MVTKPSRLVEYLRTILHSLRKETWISHQKKNQLVYYCQNQDSNPLPLGLYTKMYQYSQMSDCGDAQSATAQEKENPDKPTPKSQFVKEEEVCRAKWLKLSNVTYKDPTGKERLWEAVSRTTTSSTGVDAVMILAILRRTLKHDCMVCVRQYRPPLHAYALEFPAGLIDEGETAETAALRELLEETGYTATVKHCSPSTASDPGTANCSVVLATAEIDGDLAENHNPKPRLDDGEFVEVVYIPVSDLLTRLNAFAKQGDVVDSRVYSYAIALAQATKQRKMEAEALK